MGIEAAIENVRAGAAAFKAMLAAATPEDRDQVAVTLGLNPDDYDVLRFKPIPWLSTWSDGDIIYVAVEGGDMLALSPKLTEDHWRKIDANLTA